MKFKIVSLLLLVCISTSSCGSGGDPEGRADEMCDCFEDAGIDFDGISNERDLLRIGNRLNNLSEKDRRKSDKCILEVMSGILEDVKDMNDSEKSEYIREFAKAAIDTDCVVDVMEGLEYDEFEKMLDLVVRQKEKELD